MERILVGLHTVPVERAILEGLDSMRSSVIVAQPYTGSGGEMDSGPILAISEPVPIDLCGTSREALAAAALSDVLAEWSGLGYNSRAVRLREARRQRWEEEGERPLWRNLSMVGALGWLVVR